MCGTAEGKPCSNCNDDGNMQVTVHQATVSIRAGHTAVVLYNPVIQRFLRLPHHSLLEFLSVAFWSSYVGNFTTVVTNIITFVNNILLHLKTSQHNHSVSIVFFRPNELNFCMWSPIAQKITALYFFSLVCASFSSKNVCKKQAATGRFADSLEH